MGDPAASFAFTARVSLGAQYTSVPPSLTFDTLEQAGRLGPSVPTCTGRTAKAAPDTAGALSSGGVGVEQALTNDKAAMAHSDLATIGRGNRIRGMENIMM